MFLLTLTVFFEKLVLIHYVKSVQIRSYFWSVFSFVRTEYGIYGVSHRIQSEYKKIGTRNNCVFGQFSSSDCFRKYFIEKITAHIRKITYLELSENILDWKVYLHKQLKIT